MFTTITNVNFDNDSIKNLIKELSEKNTCGNHFDIKQVWECNEDIRSLPSLNMILYVNTIKDILNLQL